MYDIEILNLYVTHSINYIEYGFNLGFFVTPTRFALVSSLLLLLGMFFPTIGESDLRIRPLDVRGRIIAVVTGTVPVVGL